MHFQVADFSIVVAFQWRQPQNVYNDADGLTLATYNVLLKAERLRICRTKLFCLLNYTQ